MEKPNKRIGIEEWLNKEIQDILDIMDYGAVTIFLEPIHETAKMSGRGNVIFSVRFQKCYRTIYIKFFKDAVRLYNEKRLPELRHAILHEMMHVFTTSLIELAKKRFTTSEEISDCSEELTEMITLMVERLTKRTDAQASE